MPEGLELTSVQKGRDRVHLAVAVAAGEPVRTLCGKELPAGSAREVEVEADCSICQRRRKDPAAVSSAFFMGDAGERVLELSLRQAQARALAREQRPVPAPQPERRPRPRLAVRPAAQREPEPPSEPRRVGELDASGLREFSEGVFVAPGGLVVRLEGGRIAEVVGEGPYQVLRRGDRLILKAGGAILEGRIDELDLSLDRRGR